VISGREKKSIFHFTRFDDIETRQNHVSAMKNELEALLSIFDLYSQGSTKTLHRAVT
jgi:hypothetical protein